MLAEHVAARAFTRGMGAAAERLAAGDASSAYEVVANASGYVELLRQHIQKENSILFPLAGHIIPFGKQLGVAEPTNASSTRKQAKACTRTTLPWPARWSKRRMPGGP